jgi:hypothetical protein
MPPDCECDARIAPVQERGLDRRILPTLRHATTPLLSATAATIYRLGRPITRNGPSVFAAE